QVAAAMRGADLQAGEMVERAVEDQMRQRDRRLERVADRVVEAAAALQPAAKIGRGAVPLRMHEDDDTELLGLGPERIELRGGHVLAVDAAADAGAAQAVLLDALLELLGGELRMLERHRRERDEAIRIRRAGLGELLVLDPDQLARDI